MFVDNVYQINISSKYVDFLQKNKHIKILIILNTYVNKHG